MGPSESLNPKRWEITQNAPHAHFFLLSEISASWNPAVAWKVLPMYLRERKKGKMCTYRVSQNDHLHRGFARRIQTEQWCQDLLPSILHCLLYDRQLQQQKRRPPIAQWGKKHTVVMWSMLRLWVVLTMPCPNIISCQDILGSLWKKTTTKISWKPRSIPGNSPSPNQIFFRKPSTRLKMVLFCMHFYN